MVGYKVIAHMEEKIMDGLVVQHKDLKRLEPSTRVCTEKQYDLTCVNWITLPAVLKTDLKKLRHKQQSAVDQGS